MLQAMGNSKATDFRDYIFAVISLINETPSLTADYEMTLAEAYANSTKHIIQSSKSLEILGYM